MTTSNDAHHSQEWGGRLSPADVHNVLFTRAGLGRRGYDEVEVDVFLERVQQELTRLIAEKADLRDEIARLRSAQGSVTNVSNVANAATAVAAPSVDGALSKEEANLQAVRLLAAAQQTADIYVADAEKYSQRLTVDAREHSEAMVEEARQAAKRMVAEAERMAHEASSRAVEGAPDGVEPLSREQLDEQVAYLKTFGQVVRVQLKAYLEALLRDVEDEWGRADPGVVTSRAPAALPAAAATPLPVTPATPATPGTSVAVAEPVAFDSAPRSSDDVDVVEQQDSSGNGDRPGRSRRRTVTMHSR